MLTDSHIDYQKDSLDWTNHMSKYLSLDIEFHDDDLPEDHTRIKEEVEELLKENFPSITLIEVEINGHEGGICPDCQNGSCPYTERRVDEDSESNDG